MKKTYFSTAITAFICVFVMNSCADNDVYDPSKEKPVPPAENPFGPDFKAPDGFDWSMTSTVNLTVTVKDEFLGQYHYLIEVFTTNPLTNNSASPIAAGLAKSGKNYTEKITIPQTCERIFIRQTDPKQRKEVYEYEVPQNKGTLDCKLYYTETNTRAGSTEVGNSGWDIVKDPQYTEEAVTVPENAQALTGNMYNGQWIDRGTFVIKAGTEYNGSFSTNNQSTLYVAGTWNASKVDMQHVDIIVLKGGEIISTNDFFVADNSSLTIQSGSSVTCNSFGTTTKVTIKNFGTFSATKIDKNNLGLNSNSVLYNAQGATFKVEQHFKYTSSSIYNHGMLEITGEGASLGVNQNGGIIANGTNAIIKASSILDFGIVVNSGTIETNIFKNESAGALYNNCLLIAKNEFVCKTVTLDHGSITGGQDADTKEWLPVVQYSIKQPSDITLQNGSIIKADKFSIDNSINNIIGGNGDKSMIKVKTFQFRNQGDTNFKGNLILENSMTDFPGYIHTNGIARTGYDDSRYTVETCAGIINDGNEGEDPGEPKFPIEIGSGAVYTFAFEDQWPIYGDFDMNDAVVSIDNITQELNQGTDGYTYIKDILIKGQIRAIGASKTLGVAINFPNMPVKIARAEGTLKDQTQTWIIEGSGTTAAQSIIITRDIHQLMGNAAGDNMFINTTNANTPPVEFSIYLEFDNSINTANYQFNINKIDLFIFKDVQQDGKRTEIHLPGFAPTEFGKTTQFGNGNDASITEGYYVSKERLAWGICIPGDTPWAWPKETASIQNTYPNFTGWVTSGGKQNADWMNTNDGNVITIE